MYVQSRLYYAFRERLAFLREMAIPLETVLKTASIFMIFYCYLMILETHLVTTKN